MEIVMEIKQEKDIDEIKTGALVKLDHLYSYRSHDDDWNSIEIEQVKGEDDWIIPSFKYKQNNKAPVKDETDFIKTENCIDINLDIKIEGSEDLKQCELAVDIKEHIKVEEVMLPVDLKVEKHESEVYWDDSAILHTLTEELDINPHCDIGKNENHSVDLDRGARKISGGKEDEVVHKQANGGSFICYHCHCTVHSKKDLIDHINVGHRRLKGPVKKTLIVHKRMSPRSNDIKNHEKSTGSEHIMMNPESWCEIKQIQCIHCDKTFRRKRTLDDHVIINHKEFIGFVSSKIHQCEFCSYKTTISSNLTHHMIKHPESRCSLKRYPCCYCDKTFSKKIALHDHVLKVHKNNVESVSYKIHVCGHCGYETTIANRMTLHMRKHTERGCSVKRYPCIHCNKTFQVKIALHDHVIKNHKEYSTSVSSKIHNCKHCLYKTTIATDIVKHMRKHFKTVCNGKRIPCIHCDKTFSYEMDLHDHIIKNHEEFIAFVTSKIHECEHCDYKTTYASLLANHMEIHSKNQV